MRALGQGCRGGPNSRGLWRNLRTDCRGQATVELAMCVPLLLVMAFVVANLMSYVEACAAFDRIAYDAVVSQGVSPAGEGVSSPATGAIRSCIEDALGREATCSVEVRSEDVLRYGGDPDTTFSIAPRLTRYVCTLRYRPWPSGVVIAGVSMQAPAVLVHTRELVVDRYRPGVVI